jgi:hypothetical protein
MKADFAKVVAVAVFFLSTPLTFLTTVKAQDEKCDCKVTVS